MTPTEEAIAEIWREVLGRETVAPGDNFFALGGRSLNAMRVVTRVRGRLGVQAKLADVFRAPELSAFAALLDARRASEPT
ncbi:phosphopantetheine-binding protein [Streptomyces carpaticus]|uniref:phosphopantetheine-binding protein n=1 Tax=Streptomyces TaxID=1883 RepID=UPI00220850A2|nr:phosphopantetheine-binding protein [Streptomyces carpaticus]